MHREPQELLLVRRGPSAVAAVDPWLKGLTWRLKLSFGLDHALDLIRQHPPSVVLVEPMHTAQRSTELLGWLEGVCSILPVILVGSEMDADQEACLRGLGIFQLVTPRDLERGVLTGLLEEALAWGLQTGRRRPPAPSSLLVLEWSLDGLLEGVSEPLAHALGWPVKALVGQGLERVIPPASLALRDRWVQAGTQRLQLLRRDGTTWPVTLTRQPVLGAAGLPVRMVGEVQGTASRRTPDGWSHRRVMLVAQKLKAERTSQAKSRFMAAIGHDLRQPMHALGLFVEDLRRTCAEPATQTVLNHMTQSLNSMSSLLDAVLALSRLDADQLVPSLMAFPIDQILARLSAAHRGAAQDKGLRLMVGTSGAHVMSDPALVERILNNLVANAIRYTARGGVLVTCRLRGERLLIQVWDTGVGIAPQEQEAVFREFYRVANDQVAHDGAGLGLGLSIVRSCANVLGLQIGLRSEPGRGSCFSFHLPLAAVEEPDGPRVPMVQEETSWTPDGTLSMTLLLIGTDSCSETSLKPLLESWGCRVILASTLREAQIAASHIGGRLHVLMGVLSPGAEALVWSAIGSLRAARGVKLPAILITTDTSLHATRLARLHDVMLLGRPVLPARLHGLIGSLGGACRGDQAALS
ncbi:HAMP domain-containing sensor histidine kinase [uncultured Hydrogenophaga sp.]|uniref:sensor histidine kinase n=1 Tax=uncultured Hydrogenophaga sp. TaxID=199683 RepID=UPI0026601CA5|nr:PAS domain-containing sensor histidine kinase [uncultured Hydrogenophaga sp.]